MTNRKLHTPFRLVPTSTTLHVLERPIQRRILLRIADTHSIAEKMRLSEPIIKKLNEDRPILSAAYRLMTLVSGNIRFIRIFSEVPWGGGVKRQWSCRQRQFSAFLLAIFSDWAGSISNLTKYSDNNLLSAAATITSALYC